jgi:hypothetical protein
MYTNKRQNKKLKFNAKNLNETTGNIYTVLKHTLKMLNDARMPARILLQNRSFKNVNPELNEYH